jgi:hypothetical protein
MKWIKILWIFMTILLAMTLYESTALSSDDDKPMTLRIELLEKRVAVLERYIKTLDHRLKKKESERHGFGY